MKRGRLIRFIAGRYLFSKKSHSIVNIISVVSAISLAVPTAAMIVLLSVHNGLNGFIESLDSVFEPDLKIEKAEGRWFDEAALDIEAVKRTEGVKAVSRVAEENVLAEHRRRQKFLRMRGADSLLKQIVPLENTLVKGTFDDGGALLGLTAAYELGARSLYDPSLTVYSVRNDARSAFFPTLPYRSRQMTVSGIYSLDTDTENTFLIAPLDSLRELAGKPGGLTALFVGTEPGADREQVRAEIARRLDGSFTVVTREEAMGPQHRIMQQEKFMIYLILLLVLGISSFTLIGAVIMLILEKKEECGTLAVLGFRPGEIRRIFRTQGMYLAFFGIAGGTLLGLGISLLQQTYGLVKIGGASPLLSSYPVIVSPTDTLLAAATVAAVSYLAVRLTVHGMFFEKKK